MKKKIFKTLFILAIMTIFIIALSSTAFAADDTSVLPDVSMSAVLGVAAAMLIFATLIESLAEVIKAAIVPATLPKWAWFTITSVIGIVLCILFGIDLIKALGFVGGTAALIVGQIITGIAVGAGSGFVHVLLDKMNAAKTGNVLSALTSTTNKSDSDQGDDPVPAEYDTPPEASNTKT